MKDESGGTRDASVSELSLALEALNNKGDGPRPKTFLPPKPNIFAAAAFGTTVERASSSLQPLTP